MTEACILVRTGHECGQVRESRGAAVSMNFLIEHLHKKIQSGLAYINLLLIFSPSKDHRSERTIGC